MYECFVEAECQATIMAHKAHTMDHKAVNIIHIMTHQAAIIVTVMKMRIFMPTLNATTISLIILNSIHYAIYKMNHAERMAGSTTGFHPSSPFFYSIAFSAAAVDAVDVEV